MTKTNTLNDPSEFDVLFKLRENEPYITLAGRDPHAPVLVRKWAEMERADVIANVTDREEAERRFRKATDADFIAFEMDDYRKGKVIVDEVEARIESEGYSGHVLPAETEERDRQQRDTIRAAKHLSEASAQAHNAAELLMSLGHTEMAVAIGTARDLLGEAAARVRPSRPIQAQPELDVTQ